MNLEQYRKYKRILLFYSGGLDTSFLLKYFSEELKAEVITVSFDLGGDGIEIAQIEQRALSLGSKKHLHINARDMFIKEYCWPAVKANAVFEKAHPLSSSLSRPLMAQLGVDLAKQYDCQAIMHGSNGWQNNSARFDTAIKVLGRGIEIIEPIMENNVSREFEFEYLSNKGCKIEKKEDNLLSSDNNLWGREIEDGVLEFPFQEPDEEIYKLTTSPEKAAEVPEYIEIVFEKGIPTSLNGKDLNPVFLVQELNYIGGKHGVGRHDAFEDKIIGYKMREIHESPAATILITAHKDLETTVLPRKTLALKNIIDYEWANLACFGNWNHPLREQLEAFIDKANERVNGKVRVKLYKGSIRIVGRESGNGLYKHNYEESLSGYERSPFPGRNFYDYYAYESKISGLTKGDEI